MVDFAQEGMITTIHDLKQRHLHEYEQELREFTKSKPVTLILPSLYSELEHPALTQIVEELKGADYIQQIIIGLDQANAEQFAHAREFFSLLPQNHVILWNDGPRLQQLHQQLNQLNVAPLQRGKGRNVWYCAGYAMAEGKSQVVAMHDCDIRTYKRDMLARLIYPMVHPQFSFQFSKGYYARVADRKMNGRVSRLLVSPLLQALKKVFGPLDYLLYLSAFRYPLSGEMAIHVEALRDLKVSGDWGLEIGVLSEIYRNYSTKRICQVDIADDYEHKHQEVTTANGDGGLKRMSRDIALAFFRKLAALGVQVSLDNIRIIRAAYYRNALDLIDHYYYDATTNGLNYDRHSEENVVELFAQSIVEAGEQFMNYPNQQSFIPSWNRVQSACPTVFADMKQAVALDNA